MSQEAIGAGIKFSSFLQYRIWFIRQQETVFDDRRLILNVNRKSNSVICLLPSGRKTWVGRISASEWLLRYSIFLSAGATVLPKFSSRLERRGSWFCKTLVYSSSSTISESEKSVKGLGNWDLPCQSTTFKLSQTSINFQSHLQNKMIRIIIDEEYSSATCQNVVCNIADPAGIGTFPTTFAASWSSSWRTFRRQQGSSSATNTTSGTPSINIRSSRRPSATQATSGSSPVVHRSQGRSTRCPPTTSTFTRRSSKIIRCVGSSPAAVVNIYPGYNKLRLFRLAPAHCRHHYSLWLLWFFFLALNFVCTRRKIVLSIAEIKR